MSLEVSLHLFVPHFIAVTIRDEEMNESRLFELLVWPHEVEPWLHYWYRSKVGTLDAKYNLIFR